MDIFLPMYAIKDGALIISFKLIATYLSLQFNFVLFVFVLFKAHIHSAFQHVKHEAHCRPYSD